MKIEIDKEKKLIKLYNDSDIIHPHNFEDLNKEEAERLIKQLQGAIKYLR